MMPRWIRQIIRSFAEIKLLCVEDRLTYGDPTRPDESVLPLKGYKQVDDYSCGFIAGAMVLHTFWPGRSLTRFYQKVRPNEEVGTPVTRLVSALRDSGVGVNWKSGLTFRDIQRHIRNGKPIIVTVYGGRHWVVLYGVSRHEIYVAGTRLPDEIVFRRNRMRWSEFRRTWDPAGFGLVCSQK